MCKCDYYYGTITGFNSFLENNPTYIPFGVSEDGDGYCRFYYYELIVHSYKTKED